MQEGGIASLPYASSIKPQVISELGNIPKPDMSTGIVGPSLPKQNFSMMPVMTTQEIKPVLSDPLPMPVGRSEPIMSGPMPAPDMSTGVVGPRGPSDGIGDLVKAQFGGGGNQPLSGYQKYLMDTYGQRAINNIEQNVNEDIGQFVDLVRQAEQAHFGDRPGMQGPQPVMDTVPAGGGPMPQVYSQLPMTGGLPMPPVMPKLMQG